MTDIEKLCRILDERGVKWREHEAPATDCIAFFDGNGWHDCWESADGEINVTFSMTPEQAITATIEKEALERRVDELCEQNEELRKLALGIEADL